MPLTILLVTMVSLVTMSRGQFTRDSLYHAMNDRGVYLPDDYNSDLPPAQVNFVIGDKDQVCRQSNNTRRYTPAIKLSMYIHNYDFIL